MSHAASSTPVPPSATAAIEFFTCSACNAAIQANAADKPATPASAIDLIADHLLDAELWPEDSELVAEIRAMFMHNWGMAQAQADARMSRFNFKSALAALEGGAA